MSAQQVLQAKHTFGFPDQRKHANHKELAAEINLEKLRMQAAMGRSALEGVPILYQYGNLYVMRYWADDGNGDTLREIAIRPNEHIIEVSGLSGWSTEVFNVKIEIQGEIVGAGLSEESNQGRRYGGLFFSTERGERGANLFDLVDLVADAIIMVRHGLIPDRAAINAIEVVKPVTNDIHEKAETICDLKPSSTLFDFLGVGGELVFPSGAYLGIDENDKQLCLFDSNAHLSFLSGFTQETLSAALLDEDLLLTDRLPLKFDASILDFLESGGRLFFKNSSTMEIQPGVAREREIVFSTQEGNKWRYEVSDAGLANALVNQHLPNEENDSRMR